MMSAKYMALALAVLLPGCTMAPNYVRPEAPVAEAWPEDLMPKGTVLAQATDQLASEIGWKTFFTDQHLQRLIQLALDNNRDLRVSARLVPDTARGSDARGFRLRRVLQQRRFRRFVHHGRTDGFPPALARRRRDQL